MNNEDKRSQKYYYIIIGVAIGIPSAIWGFSWLFDKLWQVTRYMAIWGFVSVGIISAYIAYKIIDHKEKEREWLIQVWLYHDEHPRVPAERISERLHIPLQHVQRILSTIRWKKECGEEFVWDPTKETWTWKVRQSITNEQTKAVN